jgi:defect-in-organelle-trafficking protein DotA
MRRFILLLLSLFLIPEIAFAALPNLFTPPATDYSIRYLADIFGVVDNLLHGTGTQIMGVIFGVLNSALLVLAGMIFTYIIFVGILKTAEEGKMLGQKWSSIWILLRAVVGFGLLVPNAMGYSFIQVIVIWIVIQGVGVADTLWDATLKYIQNGGVIIQPTPPPKMLDSALMTPAASVYKSQICMYAIANSLRNNNTEPDVQIPAFLPSQPTWTTADHTTAFIEFPAVNTMVGTTDYHGVCGSITWKVSNDDMTPLTTGEISRLEQLLEGAPFNYTPVKAQYYANSFQFVSVAIKYLQGKTTPPLPQAATQQQIDTVFPNAQNQFSDSRTIAVKQMIADTAPLAQQVADTIIPPNGTTSSGSDSIQALQDSLYQMLQGRQDISNAATDYIGIMQPYYNLQATKNQQGDVAFIGKSEEQGWIMAGTYYYNLAQLNNTLYTETSIPTAAYKVNFAICANSNSLICVGSNAVPPAMPDWMKLASVLTDRIITGQCTSGQPIDGNICQNVNNSSGGTPGVRGYVNNEPVVVQTAINAAVGEVTTKKNYTLGKGAFSWTIPIPGGATSSLKSMLMSPFDLWYSGTVPQAIENLGNPWSDPLIAISQLGVALVNWAETVWISGAVGIFGLQILAGVASFINPVWIGLISALLWYFPLVMSITLGGLVTGATMAYYVPLIPFILFLFASLGWFIGVIESLVAAPLVALGIAHPEGDEVMGKAEPAIMLILNLFLRPSLIIVGFIAGMALSHVGLWLLNMGIGSVMGNETPDWLGLISTVAGLVIYVTIAVTVVNKSFALIHEVPDKVLRWLSGGQQAQFGDSGQALQEISGKVESGLGQMKAGAEAAAPTSEYGRGGAAETGKAMRGTKKGKTKSDVE